MAITLTLVFDPCWRIWPLIMVFPGHIQETIYDETTCGSLFSGLANIEKLNPCRITDLFKLFIYLIAGITGNVKVDNNGDREPDYWIWDLLPGEYAYKVALEASLTSSDSKVNSWAVSLGKMGS